MSRKTRFAPIFAAVLLSTSMIAGCGAKDDTGKPSASQVAAKVNKGEISVHQVNTMLARAGNIPQDQVKNVTNAALDRLVEQELMVQKALDEKLDRDPKVLQAIEFARREILAHAYGEQIASKAPQPTEAQISTFYDENPDLFSKRRVYDLQETNIRVPPDKMDDIRERFKQGGTLQQIGAWLTEQKLPFQVSGATGKGGEQLPPDIRKLNPGQAIAVPTPTGLALFSVIATRDEPVDRVKAKPYIQNMLLNRQRAEMVQAEVKRLRDTAAIQYVGEFGPPVKPEPGAAAPAPAPEQKPAEPAASTEQDDIRSAIEKGASSLK